MTPIQLTYLNKHRAMADANLAFFEHNSPSLHALLVREGVAATLDISDQGDLTVRYADGLSKSVTMDILATEAKLVNFADLEDRPQVLAFHKLRSVSENPSHGEMQRYHYSNLDAEYPNRVKRHFAEHYRDNSALSRYPSYGEKVIPLLIVLGSGLGWHIPRLLLEYRIRHMIVIDTDVDAFRLSVFFQDYVLISRVAMEQATNLTFIVQSDIEAVSQVLRNVIVGKGGVPGYFIHGAALYYAMDESETVEEIRKSITDTLWQLFFGLGYFDDELVTVKHTFDNLRNQIPIYANPGVVNKDAVAFVVGSGPSLDNLLPILREYKDRAVVFSCGSALSALKKAGIRPDFHVEKERPYLTYEVVISTVGKEFLEGIRFLGSNVVHTDMFLLFERSAMLIKWADTMGLLLAQKGIPNEVILKYDQPTVTNTAVDFALSAGFRQIYLFGVDLGYKVKEKHHSEHTFYLSEMPEEDHLKSLLSQLPPSDQIVPGNFGGEVFTDKILYVARQFMGSTVSIHPEACVFNLNDGALIKGAVPLHADEFRCEGTVTGKVLAIQAIDAACEVRAFDLNTLAENLLAQIDGFIAACSEIVTGKCESRVVVIDKLVAMRELLIAEEVNSAPVALLFRGTVTHLLSLAYNALSIIKDEDEVTAKAEYDFANLVDFLAQARLEVARILEQAHD